MARRDVDVFALLDGQLSKVSDSDTNGREQIQYIDLELLDADEANFYSIKGIHALAANIELCGLQQPLRVRPAENGRYKVVSGHRRRAALQSLAAEDPEKWRQAACIVEHGDESPAMRELRLILANSDTRQLTPAEISKQAERVERLLYQLKEEGVVFPGRMRDQVAAACSSLLSGAVQCGQTAGVVRLRPGENAGWPAGGHFRSLQGEAQQLRSGSVPKTGSGGFAEAEGAFALPG